MDQISEEFFDIVNAQDEVVGRATRKETHARGLWHRAVHVLVFDRQGRVFLQKRSLRKDTAPGCWDSSCSGHVDSGEDYDHAAARELGEEIGITVAAAPKRWFRIEARQETGWEFVWVYRLKHEGPFVLHPDEIECGDWFELGEVTRQIAEKPAEFALSFRYIWALAQKAH